tara:strand:+ start:233 stop:406 length:174 start_codon:yes stop_codon:yes gene_type:complete
MSGKWIVDVSSVYEQDKEVVNKLKNGKTNHEDWLIKQVKEGTINIVQYYNEETHEEG